MSQPNNINDSNLTDEAMEDCSENNTENYNENNENHLNPQIIRTKPKRPKSAWILFVYAVRKNILENKKDHNYGTDYLNSKVLELQDNFSNNNIFIKDLNIEISKIWKKARPEDKALYINLAKLETKKYKEQLNELDYYKNKTLNDLEQTDSDKEEKELNKKNREKKTNKRNIDPNKPKVMGSYILFHRDFFQNNLISKDIFNDETKKLFNESYEKFKNKELKGSECTKMLSEEWRKFDKDIKDYYHELSIKIGKEINEKNQNKNKSFGESLKPIIKEFDEIEDINLIDSLMSDLENHEILKIERKNENVFEFFYGKDNKRNFKFKFQIEVLNDCIYILLSPFPFVEKYSASIALEELIKNNFLMFFNDINKIFTKICEIIQNKSIDVVFNNDENTYNLQLKAEFLGENLTTNYTLKYEQNPEQLKMYLDLYKQKYIELYNKEI